MCLPICLPVIADEGAIRRALHNLVTNALKYAADGRWVGISARVTTSRGEPEVQIAVSDRGRGIAAEDLAHIFEPFYRGQYAIDRQIHGNGLGLSLVQPDCRSARRPRHRGVIGRRRVDVHAARAGRSRAQSAALRTDDGDSGSGWSVRVTTPPRKRVLLVEDEPGLVLTLTDRLQERRLRGRGRHQTARRVC